MKAAIINPSNAQANIDLANRHETWQQIKASFALEGIELTDEDTEIAGRYLSGQITLDEGLAEIRRAFGVEEAAPLELVRG